MFYLFADKIANKYCTNANIECKLVLQYCNQKRFIFHRNHGNPYIKGVELFLINGMQIANIISEKRTIKDLTL